MFELTDRQRAVLDFIRKCIADRGYPPTVREMMDQFGHSAPNGIVSHMKALRKKGYIEWEPKLARSIRLTAKATDEVRGIPIIDLSKVTE